MGRQKSPTHEGRSYRIDRRVNAALTEWCAANGGMSKEIIVEALIYALTFERLVEPGQFLLLVQRVHRFTDSPDEAPPVVASHALPKLTRPEVEEFRSRLDALLERFPDYEVALQQQAQSLKEAGLNRVDRQRREARRRRPTD